MDLFRMIKMKSLYVTFIIYVALCFFNTYAEYVVGDLADVEPPYVSEIWSSLAVTVLLLVSLIFVAMFVASDISNGFVKCYVGQLRDKTYRIFSKFICSVVYFVVLFIASIAVQIVIAKITWQQSGSPEIGDVGYFAKTALAMLLFYTAFSCVVIFFSTFSKGSGVPVMIAVLITFSALSLLTSLIDMLLITAEIDFRVTKYVLSSHVEQMYKGINDIDAGFVIPLAICYVVLFLFGACFIYKKKDVN